MEYVKALEGRDSPARGEQVLAALHSFDIKPVIQECRWPKIRNIIVDSPSEPGAKRQLFSAHYDAVKGCPAANDNASGVAVLLGLCREIKRIRVPARVVFFDREEAWFRTPLLRLGLLGSLYYVWRNDLRQLAAVYNLEYCGRGELLGVWPVRAREASLAAVREVAEAAARLALPFQTVHIPWPLLSSDHLSFRLKGMANAITLSLLPQSQVPALENLLTGLSIPRLLTGHRPVLPELLSSVHTLMDSSSRLSESSLQLILSLVLELIEGYRLASSRITSR